MEEEIKKEINIILKKVANNENWDTKNLRIDLAYLYEKIIILDLLESKKINFSNEKKETNQEEEKVNIELKIEVPKEEVTKQEIKIEEPKQGIVEEMKNSNLIKVVLGLNDRISFLNNLFGGDTEKLNKAVEKINSINSKNDMTSLFETFKNENKWTDNVLEYSNRFEQIMMGRFSSL